MGNYKRVWSIQTSNGKRCRIDSTTKPKLFGEEITTVCGNTYTTSGDVERKKATCEICNSDSYGFILQKSIYEYPDILDVIQQKDSGQYVSLTSEQLKLVETLKERKITYLYKSGTKTRVPHILGRYLNES